MGPADDSRSRPSRRQLLSGLGSATAAAVVGCAELESGAEHGCLSSVAGEGCARYPDDVRLFQKNLERQAYYPEETVPDSVTVEWSFEHNSVGHTAAKSTPMPSLDGELIIFASDDGLIQARTPDGDQVWTEQTEATDLGFHGSPTVVGNRAFVGGYDGAIYSLDVETGERIWKTTATRLDGTLAVGSSPAFHDGVLYFIVEYGSPSSGALWALAPRTGEPIWQDDPIWGQSHPSPTIDRETERIVAGSNDGVVYGWTYPEGELVWEYQAGPEGGPQGKSKGNGAFNLGAQIKGTVAAHEGLGYVGSWDHYFHCIDLEDGSGVWTFDTADVNMSNPALDPEAGVVYTGSDHGMVWALDTETGEELWAADVGGRVIGALTVTAGTVLVGSYDTHVYALDKETGERRWRVPNRARVTSAPIPVDGRIYYAERGRFSNYYDDDEETELERPGDAYCLVGDE